MDNIAVDNFLKQYLAFEDDGPPVYYPKSDDATVVFDAWRVIGENFMLEQSEPFYHALTKRWMEPGRIRWCPQEPYKPAIEAIQKGNAYESLRHLRRLANNGMYMEFPVMYDAKELPSIWRKIIERTIFQIHCEPQFYEQLAHYWLSYFDRAIRLLCKCVEDQNVDRFTNHIYLMSKYGFDVRSINRLVMDNISFEAIDHWERLLSLRAKRLQLNESFDVYSQVVLHLLSDFDAYKNVRQTIQRGNETEFLEEYFYLSEAGFQMKFPLYLNNIQKIKPVWEEAIFQLDANADAAFIHRVSQLWIQLINPVAERHEHWADKIVFELIEALAKKVAAA